jgi:hypothetical protein
MFENELFFFLFLNLGFVILTKLALNSWVQVILLPHPPK